MTTTTLETTQAVLRHILHGNSPNGTLPADCGSYSDIIMALYDAHTAGGTEAVRRVFDVLARRHPELSRLVSGPDLQPEIPPALTDTGLWLDTPTVLKAFGRGETGDAELLVALYADRLAYDHAERQWYLWNGYHWEADARKQIGNLVANNVAAQYLHAAADVKRVGGDNKDTDQQIMQLSQRAGRLRNRNKINNVLALAVSQPTLALTGTVWDNQPLLLAVANGVIDLMTGDFRPGHPTDYIRTATPVAWQGLNAPAPRWERFLEEVFAGDFELIAFMQRLLGYAITGNVTEHILPIFWGNGRNGKDTLLETLKAVLGPMAEPVSKDVLIDRRAGNSGSASPHLYALRSLRLAWVSETNAGARFNVEQVKLLTGGGAITARPLFSNMITFTPRYLLILITNHKPRTNADDYALWKRLLLVPFTEAFVDNPMTEHEHKADSHLVEKLKAESGGILTWLIRGCLAWQREGLNPPESIRLATETYQAEEDDLSLFIEDCCLVGPDYEVRGGPLYTAYRQWAESYGMRPTSNVVFGKRMGRRFEKRLSAGVIYSGIGLLTEQVSS